MARISRLGLVAGILGIIFSIYPYLFIGLFMLHAEPLLIVGLFFLIGFILSIVGSVIVRTKPKVGALLMLIPGIIMLIFSIVFVAIASVYTLRPVFSFFIHITQDVLFLLKDIGERLLLLIPAAAPIVLSILLIIAGAKALKKSKLPIQNQKNKIIISA